jgi:glycosyltransferase involved in cell wall biosynthesis
MKISVVVQAKNEEKYLPICLNALRKQLLRPEIVVVYGPSNDRTVQIAKKLADKVVFDHGKGFTPARNMGWKAATGDIVAYCDADAVPNKDWTARIAKHFTNPMLLALSGPLILSGKSSLNIRLAFKMWAELFPDFWALMGHNNIWGANMAFRRSILKKFPFNAKFLEDYDIGRRLRRHGFKRQIKFDRHFKMPASDRRFKRSFYRTAIKYYAINWLRINFNRQAKGYLKA